MNTLSLAPTLVSFQMNYTYVSPGDIDTALLGLDRNTKSISGLLKNLNSLMEKLGAIMRLKSLSKEVMTTEQIKAFSGFKKFYDQETKNLDQKLSRVSNLKKKASDDMLLESFDLEQIHKKLLNITLRQEEAIKDIGKVISHAEKTLSLIS